MAKDEFGNRINSFGEITASFDFVAHAKRTGLKLTDYWRTFMVPTLLTLPHHTRKALKDRVEAMVTDLVPSATFRRFFAAFVQHPEQFPWRTLGMEFGVTQRYIALRLLSYLEKAYAAGEHLPHPLNRYLAAIIPGKLDDTQVTALCKSLEYPHTLGSFTAFGIAYKAKQEKDRIAKERNNTRGTHYAVSWAEYRHQRTQAYHARVTYLAGLLNAPTSMPLKEFAKVASTVNPLSPAKRRPNLAAVMEFIRAHLLNHLDHVTVVRLAAEARHFLTMIPQDAHPEAYRRLSAMLFDDPIDRRLRLVA